MYGVYIHIPPSITARNLGPSLAKWEPCCTAEPASSETRHLTLTLHGTLSRTRRSTVNEKRAPQQNTPISRHPPRVLVVSSRGDSFPGTPRYLRRPACSGCDVPDQRAQWRAAPRTRQRLGHTVRPLGHCDEPHRYIRRQSGGETIIRARSAAHHHRPCHSPCGRTPLPTLVPPHHHSRSPPSLPPPSPSHPTPRYFGTVRSVSRVVAHSPHSPSLPLPSSPRPVSLPLRDCSNFWNSSPTHGWVCLPASPLCCLLVSWGGWVPRASEHAVLCGRFRMYTGICHADASQKLTTAEHPTVVARVCTGIHAALSLVFSRRPLDLGRCGWGWGGSPCTYTSPPPARNCSADIRSSLRRFWLGSGYFCLALLCWF